MTETISRERQHELLVRARNEIERRGLTKNLLETSHGQVCARGAILVASGAPRLAEGRLVPYFPSWSSNPEVRAVDDAVAEANGMRVGRGIIWSDLAEHNNHPDTTQEDVLGWFDRAIEATAPMPEDPMPEPMPERDLATVA